SAENIIADEHESAVVILQRVAVQEVDFFGLHAASGFRELEEGRSGAVSGGAEDVIAVDNRSGDAGCAIPHARVTPQELARLGVNANATGPGSHKLHILPDPRSFGDDDRRIT